MVLLSGTKDNSAKNTMQTLDSWLLQNDVRWNGGDIQ